MLVRPLAVLAAFAALTFAGCGGGDDVPQTSAGSAHVVDDSPTVEPSAPAGPSQDDLQQFFEALATDDPDNIADVLSLTAQGSLARAYATYLVASGNASVQSGTQPVAAKLTVDDGVYRLSCDQEPCPEYSGVEASGNLIADFKINRKSIADRITLGSGKTYKAGALATVKPIAAYQSPISKNLFVVVEVRAHQDVTMGWSSDTYVGPDGVQTASDSTTGPGKVHAGAKGTFSYVFPRAKVGGKAYLTVVADDDSGNSKDATVEFPTK